MFKKENLRKNFFRVKQFAGQNLGRVEKTEVLTNDLQLSEKRVDVVKHACGNTLKKLGTSLLGAGTTDVEKRLKKIPEAGVGHSMIESAGVLGPESLMGQMYQTCGECESTLAQKHLQYELDVEQKVLKPLEDIIEIEIPQISKLKRALNKLTLDMDAAKSRWNAAVRQTQVPGTNMSVASAKADTVKEELEEATSRMEQAKDAYTTGMLKFISREAEQSNILVALLEVQAQYHREALAEIERALPKMLESLSCNPAKPVYGISLEEHLRVTNRDIAQVLEACVVYLIEFGLEEEGLFRIAGMASKVKKLKASFDAGVDLDDTGDLDPHTVAGALKQYLRELPEPLLTYDLFNEFVKAVSQPADQRLQALWRVVDQLPKPNYDNFRYLVKFLSELTKRSDLNKMTPGNIAIVIGPNLIWSEGDTGPNMSNTAVLSLITELIIQHADWFFPGALDFHATQRGTAPEHRMREHPQLPEKPGNREMKVSQSASDAARAAIPGPSAPPVATNTNVVVQRKKMVAMPSQESSTDISTSSSESASLSDLSPQMKDYENADTLERGDNSESYHTAKGDICLAKVDTLQASVDRPTAAAFTNKGTNHPVLRFNPKDRSKYKDKTENEKLKLVTSLSSGASVMSQSGSHPSSPATQSVHSDVYSTVFALQSLGDGTWPTYLSKVRGLWEDHLHHNSTLPAATDNGLAHTCTEKGQGHTRSSQGITKAAACSHLEINFGGPMESQSPKQSPKLEKANPHAVSATPTDSSGLKRSSSNHSVSSHGTPQSSPANQEAASTTAPPSTPPTAVRSTSISPAGSHANLTGAPVAESEDLPSPQQPVMRRVIRKPAPPPPPQVERPYSVAVSASFKPTDTSQTNQHQTWPRQAAATQQEEEVNAITMATSDKRKTLPPERPCPPERTSSIPQNQGHFQSNTLERPKVPPPIVPPKHTRSASTGTSITIPSTLFEGHETLSGTESPRLPRTPGDKAASSSNHTQLNSDRHSHPNSLSKQNSARMSRPMPPPPPPPGDSSIVEETHL